MKSSLQATIDICFKISNIRNLCNKWIGPMYFTIKTKTDNNTFATPYQILNDQAIKSKIDLQSYKSQTLILNCFDEKQINEIIIFKIHVAIEYLNSIELNTIIQLKSLTGQIQTKYEIKFESIIGINNFIPCLFRKYSCNIDIVITTHLLAFKNIGTNYHFQKIMYYKALDNLILSYNKLRKRISQQNLPIELMNETCLDIGSYDEIYKFQNKNNHQYYIFKAKKTKNNHNNKILKNIMQEQFPQINIKLQLLWNYFLKEKLNQTVDQDRKYYFQNQAVKLKKLTYVSNLSNQRQCKASDVTIKILNKAESQSKLETSVTTFQQTSKHIIILVHGLGSSSSAMAIFAEYIKFAYPKIYVLNSKANQYLNQQSVSIVVQGRNLSIQIQQYINNFNKHDFQISFIGYSIGGLVIRSALPYLQAYKSHMRCLITLSTPHLGHLFHNTTLTKLGMRVCNHIEHSQVLDCLLMGDHQDYRYCLMYRLSQFMGLNWFQQILLLGCHNDGYVSVKSALIQHQFKENTSNKQEIIISQMCRNINMNLQNTILTKMEVNFQHIKNQNMLDWFLGKTSHIAYLNQEFIRNFILCNRRLFI